MRKTLVFSFVLVCGAYLSAQAGGGSASGAGSGSAANAGQSTSSGQSSTSDQNSTSSHTSEHAGAHKVKGCLSGSSGNYTITDKSGTTYQLTGDTSKLADHVGHTVEISGTPSSSTEGASASGTSGASTSGASGGAEKTLSVTSIKHISPTCSSPSK